MKTSVVLAEVPFKTQETECPRAPQEFLALANATAMLKEELDETKQILSATLSGKDQLQDEVNKLRRCADPGSSDAVHTAEVHCETTASETETESDNDENGTHALMTQRHKKTSMLGRRSRAR